MYDRQEATLSQIWPHTKYESKHPSGFVAKTYRNRCPEIRRFFLNLFMATENLIAFLFFNTDFGYIYIEREPEKKVKKKWGPPTAPPPPPPQSRNHKSQASQLLLLLLPACHGSTYYAIMLSLTTLLCKVLCGGPQGPSARRKGKTTKKKGKDTHTHLHSHTHADPDTHTRHIHSNKRKEERNKKERTQS